jgi:hypothetical protein
VTSLRWAPRCGDQRVDHRGRPAVERAGQAGEEHPPGLLRLAAHRDRPHGPGERVERDGGERGDRQVRRHDLQRGVAVADDVADVGALGEAGPHAEELFARRGSAGHPDLAGQLADLDRAPPGERVAGARPDQELALPEDREVEPRGLGVGRTERGRLRDHGQVDRPGPQRAGQRRRGALADRHDQIAGERGHRGGHQPGHGVRERPQPHGAGRRSWPELACRGVELVEDPRGPVQQPRARGGRGHAVAPPVEQRPAGDGLQRRHLPRDRRLRVAERAGRGRERAGPGHLDQHPQTGRREVASHAGTVCQAFRSIAFAMVDGRRTVAL